MDDPFPEPTTPHATATEVFVTYLNYFRSGIVARVEQLPELECRQSRLSSKWTPLELVKHLTYVEMRWLEWGFEGQDVDDPWGDSRERRWFVDVSETREELLAALRQRGERSTSILERHDLDEVGEPGPRWDGAAPPTLERIVLHLVQEYARHLGHLDIVVELSGGPVGE